MPKGPEAIHYLVYKSHSHDNLGAPSGIPFLNIITYFEWSEITIGK
jgi:hypothetical protein